MTPADPRLERARALIGRHEAIEGWATVDLDASAESVLTVGGRIEPAAADELLGARCLLIRQAAGAGDVVLLEPNTEGRLAATLARHGEGPAVTYLVASDDPAVPLLVAGVPLSAAAGGPLGQGRLLLGGDRWGPHVIAVHREDAVAAPPADTIER
jgi:hypothetical protein